MLRTLPDLGYAGLVVEGMVAAHAPSDAAPLLGEIATRIPVVLATPAMTGPVFTRTYGYPGSEIDLIKRNLVPAGYLSRLKARLLLGCSLRRNGTHATVREAFAVYQ